MTMNARRRSLLIVFAALFGVPPLYGGESLETASVTKLADLDLESDGKEVTMIFKITKTQLIAGAHEGEYPHAILHHAKMKEAPNLVVYAKGDLADALHRFSCIGPKGCLVGRSIKVSGHITVHKDFPAGEDQTPIYDLDLRDWKAFQILPEPERK
jgi:hypothetical protein